MEKGSQRRPVIACGRVAFCLSLFAARREYEGPVLARAHHTLGRFLWLQDTSLVLPAAGDADMYDTRRGGFNGALSRIRIFLAGSTAVSCCARCLWARTRSCSFRLAERALRGRFRAHARPLYFFQWLCDSACAASGQRYDARRARFSSALSNKNDCLAQKRGTKRRDATTSVGTSETVSYAGACREKFCAFQQSLNSGRIGRI